MPAEAAAPGPAGEEPILAVAGLVKRFGGVLAVDGLDLSVREGEIRGLIGPNGAGKTTTFNLISGFNRPDAGRIRYRGEELAGRPMHEIAARGVVRTFQHATLFLELSVRENIEVGCHTRVRPGPFAPWAGGLFASGGRRRAQSGIDREVDELLEFFGLGDRQQALAAELPYGQQRALGVAIAVAARPRILLLDEPFAGMNPEETGRMMELVSRLRASGLTILLVEHDMRAVMGLCDRITVMEFGRLLAEGEPEQIRADPRVVQAYLGGGGDAA